MGTALRHEEVHKRCLCDFVPLWFLLLTIKMAFKAGIDMVCFPLVTGAAEGLQIADIVLTTASKGNNMVNRKVSF